MELFKNTLTKHKNNLAKTNMSGISDTPVGPPEEYGGSPETLNPEELFVASINSCLMLVFQHFANKKKLDIDFYTSTAEGAIEKTKDGLRFTKVTVNAAIKPVS